MDFGRFLENLPGDYKTNLLSLAMIFPMAYIDCWKLSPSFAELEILKQVFLAAGISVILMIAGEMLNVGYLRFSGYWRYINNLSLPVIITPTATTTVCVVIFGTHHPLSFFFVMTGIIMATLGIALMNRPSLEREENKRANKEQKDDEKSKSTGNNNHNDTTDDQ
ncbi:MAG: hypothetical protein K2L45_03155 [Muribaculaceae bacterium]|nr:hypothetical protein [Muribaculaceae bacterium]